MKRGEKWNVAGADERKELVGCVVRNRKQTTQYSSGVTPERFSLKKACCLVQQQDWGRTGLVQRTVQGGGGLFGFYPPATDESLSAERALLQVSLLLTVLHLIIFPLRLPIGGARRSSRAKPRVTGFWIGNWNANRFWNCGIQCSVRVRFFFCCSNCLELAVSNWTCSRSSTSLYSSTSSSNLAAWARHKWQPESGRFGALMPTGWTYRSTHRACPCRRSYRTVRLVVADTRGSS